MLEVIGLTTHFVTYRGERVVKAVDGLSFSVKEGDTVALIGESCSGKTTILSILRVLPPAACIIVEKIILGGENILEKSNDYMCRVIRGKKISMIPQDPMRSLAPLFTIEDQVAEPLALRQNMRRPGITDRIKELL